MPANNKRLRIMAGPNGSGKSTVLAEVRKNFYSGPFVNADEIEKAFNEKRLLNLPALYDLVIEREVFDTFLAKEGESWLQKARRENMPINLDFAEGMLIVKDGFSSYDAALAADFVRTCLIRQGVTFTFETVMSHSSKIVFLKQAIDEGYKNYLYFICTLTPDINVQRVHQRAALGGHNVPEDRIRKRYYESLSHLQGIIPLCHRVYLFDNSEQQIIKPVAEINTSRDLIIHSKKIPWWVEEYVIAALY